MTDDPIPVAIVGAGPTGLMLAGELALAGVGFEVLERRANQQLMGARAGGLHARTLEVLDQRGIADRFRAAGKAHPAVGFSGITLDISDFPTRHNLVLELWQVHIERLLHEWVSALGVSVSYSAEVATFAQDDDGVDVTLAGGRRLRARYLVGCDGGRSLVRRTAGIAFPGSDPTTSNLIAEAELADEPPEWGIRRDAVGIHSLSRMDDGRTVRVLVTERDAGAASEPTLRDLSEALVSVYGSDFGIHSPTWISRFTDATRQAASYRDHRVLLAGDAAHVHPPDGGHGLQLGVQDAVNLGWKLAQVIKGLSPEGLLDTYHAERHPVGARVLENTRASVALRRADGPTQALRATMAELLALDEPRRRLAALMSGLDVRYDMGAGHPLLGRRMPDLDLVTADGPRRTYTLLHDARPVLLRLSAPSGVDVAAWGDRVRRIDAAYTGAWELPVVGRVPSPSAVLIRPDGYVAWVGDGSAVGLAEAMTAWFGSGDLAREARRSTEATAARGTPCWRSATGRPSSAARSSP